MARAEAGFEQNTCFLYRCINQRQRRQVPCPSPRSPRLLGFAGRVDCSIRLESHNVKLAHYVHSQSSNPPLQKKKKNNRKRERKKERQEREEGGREGEGGRERGWRRGRGRERVTSTQIHSELIELDIAMCYNIHFK